MQFLLSSSLMVPHCGHSIMYFFPGRYSSTTLITGRVRSLADLPRLLEESAAIAVPLATSNPRLARVDAWQSMFVYAALARGQWHSPALMLRRSSLALVVRHVG